MNRGDPTMTIYRVIEATWAEQVKDHMTGQCMSTLATACSSTISGERVGLGNHTLGLRRRWRAI